MPRCNCENTRCWMPHAQNDVWQPCRNDADGTYRVVDLGAVCKGCYFGYDEVYRRSDQYELENPLSSNAKIALAVGGLGLVGLAIYVATRPVATSTTTTTTIPPVAAPGPYIQLALPAGYVSGETYLLSSPAVAGVSLATVIANMQSQAATTGITVNQYWDVNQRPSNWPSIDLQPNNWRMSVTYNAVVGQTPQVIAAGTNAYAFTTNGMMA